MQRDGEAGLEVGLFLGPQTGPEFGLNYPKEEKQQVQSFLRGMGLSGEMAALAPWGSSTTLVLLVSSAGCLSLGALPSHSTVLGVLGLLASYQRAEPGFLCDLQPLSSYPGQLGAMEPTCRLVAAHTAWRASSFLLAGSANASSSPFSSRSQDWRWLFRWLREHFPLHLPRRPPRHLRVFLRRLQPLRYLLR